MEINNQKPSEVLETICEKERELSAMELEKSSQSPDSAEQELHNKIFPRKKRSKFVQLTSFDFKPIFPRVRGVVRSGNYRHIPLFEFRLKKSGIYESVSWDIEIGQIFFLQDNQDWINLDSDAKSYSVLGKDNNGYNYKVSFSIPKSYVQPVALFVQLLELYSGIESKVNGNISQKEEGLFFEKDISYESNCSHNFKLMQNQNEIQTTLLESYQSRSENSAKITREQLFPFTELIKGIEKTIKP